MRFASLGSGSRGNATLVEAGTTRLLVDNGFSLRESLRRLERLAVAPDTLSGILLTHEHSDHVGGVVALARRFGLPVWATAGTQRAMAARGLLDGAPVDFRRVLRGQAFTAGDVAVEPVRVPHDAAEPVQYVFQAGGARLGVLTDLGSLTDAVVAAYRDCDALCLECNHDADMLRNGPYHAALKRRVGGDLGHLSNAQAAALLRQVDGERLQVLLVSHLSETNNTEHLARLAAATALGWEAERVRAACQMHGHDWLAVQTTQCAAIATGA
jgi:phosphoribosyl 1,2-cyclic phosphodiesterase